MKKATKFLLSALVLVCATCSFAQSGSAKDVLKSIMDFRQAQFKGATAMTRELFDSIQKQVKDKAIEAVKGVDPHKIDAKDAADWAQIFQMAERHKDACDLCHLYLSTNPEPDKKFQTQMLMMTSCNALGEADMLMGTLKDAKPTDYSGGANLTNSTVYVYADTIRKAKGVDAAISALDAVQKNSPPIDADAVGKQMYDSAKQNPNFKSQGSEEADLKRFVGMATQRGQSLNLAIAQKKAELYNENHQRQKATDELDSFTKALPAESPLLKQAKLIRTQITLPDSPVPALNMERGYGDFPGLAALKGKVVVLDFFAHWCGPCKDEFPEMKKLYADLKSKGVEVVGVTTYYGYYKQDGFAKRDMPKDTEYAHMQEFIKEFDLTWPVVYGDRSNFEAFGVTGIPHVVVIDRNGIVRKIEIGYLPANFAKLRKEIEDIASK